MKRHAVASIALLAVVGCQDTTAPKIGGPALDQVQVQKKLPPEVIVGPRFVKCRTSSPVQESYEFTIADYEHYEQPFSLRVANGSPDGSGTASVAEVWLGDELMFGPSDFAPAGIGPVRKLLKSVIPDRQSILRISVESCPAYVLVWIEAKLKPERARVGPAGGTIHVSDGTTLEIPAGALSTPTVIHVTPISNYTSPPSLGLGPDSRAWRLEPEGLNLALPVTMRLEVSGMGEVPGGFLPTDRKVAHFAEDGSFSELISPRFLFDGQAIEFTIDHFSVVLTFFGGQSESTGRWSVFGFKWRVPTIEWYVESTTLPTILSVAEIEAALSQWQAASSGLRFHQTNSRADANLVFVEDGVIDCRIPLTGIRLCDRYGDTDFPFSAYLPWSVDLGPSHRITVHMASSDLHSSETDIRSSLLHEIGHALGIAHTPKDFWSVLPNPAGSAPLMNDGEDYFPLVLRPDDIAAVQFLYGGSVVGGTYFDRNSGLIGTAFLFNPLVPSGSMSFVDIGGPPGWNAGNPFRCSRHQPSGTAANRSFCWLFTSPVSGTYTAAGSAGNQPVISSFQVDAGAHLDAPQIISLNVAQDHVSVQWTAPSAARSFLVRVNPLPFTGVTSERVVSGDTHAATFTGLSLVAGASYQAVVFAFDKDVMTPDELAGSFRVGAHGVVFTGPGVSSAVR